MHRVVAAGLPRSTLMVSIQQTIDAAKADNHNRVVTVSVFSLWTAKFHELLFRPRLFRDARVHAREPRHVCRDIGPSLHVLLEESVESIQGRVVRALSMPLLDQLTNCIE